MWPIEESTVNVVVGSRVVRSFWIVEALAGDSTITRAVRFLVEARRRVEEEEEEKSDRR